ncbi:MAG: hypothetical protein ACLTK7_08765 [Clostridium paraputrificum]|uniref:hypothetical protein n=1 Tax=Clostridium paraputrificum TaxID=29363 RepID=UPI000C06DF6E|nr:hypothetical protein [Clostridium paraputrificum]
MNKLKEEFASLSTGEIITKEQLKSDLMKELVQAEAGKQKGNEIRKSKEKFSVFIGNNFGSFFFNKYNKTLDKFIVYGKYESAMAFRFLYLCSYMDYENKLRFGSKFREKDRGYMVEKDLEEVLGLSERETRNTKKFLFNLGVLKMDSEGVLFVDKMYSKKGKITESFNRESTRVFDNSIKEMYLKADAKEHKKLGVFFKLLPMINYKFNVVCHNPKEEDVTKIKPMKQKEIFKYLGVTKNTYVKLLDIKVNDRYVYAKISTGALKGFFVVNPDVYYAGNNIEELKGIINLFKIGI